MFWTIRYIDAAQLTGQLIIQEKREKRSMCWPAPLHSHSLVMGVVVI